MWPLRDVLSKLLLLVPESGAASAAAAGRAVDSTASVGSDSGGGVGGVFRTAGGRRRGGRGGGARRGRDVRPFLRDVMDHMLQVMDILESYRSVVGGLMELYLGNANNRMQEIMKTLTVVSVLFVPMTFLSSVYGMNFEDIPELSWAGSYPLFWAVVLCCIFGQMIFFRRRGWI